MNTRLIKIALLMVLLIVGGTTAAMAEDWPMYRHDRLRSAVTSERLALPLTQVWSLKTRASQRAPKPTENPLGSPYPESARYNVPMIAVGDAVYFSSAEEGRLACLDAATGKTRWEFVAGGPVNRSPTFVGGRLYVGSSDGYIYCLNAAKGTPIWKFCAAPANRWFLYYGRMISCWAVMTDVQVFEGIAYFAAGVFPHDGTFLYAVDAASGKSLWRSSQISENGWRNSLAPGGHLYVTQANVWVPKDFGGYSGIGYGNGLPFRRADGKYLSADGGPDPERPKWSPTFMPLIGAVKDGVRYCGSIAWKVEGEESKREVVWQQEIPGRWTDADSAVGSRWGGKYHNIFRYDPDLCSAVVAGDTLFHSSLLTDPKLGVGSGIYARDLKDGAQRWTVELGERANQLIVANGRLLVGTRSGTICCFATQGTAAGGNIVETSEAQPFQADAGSAAVADKTGAAAEGIIAQTGVRDGYAVVLDCESGRLPLELARRTNLYICAVFRDAAAMQLARAAYTRAGLHVSRIVTWHQEPGAKLPYSNFVADLVTSEAAALGGALPADHEEIARISKPIRGVVLIGGGDNKEQLAAWTKATGLSGWQIVSAGSHWAKRVRPPLEDAGAWTHMYGDPGQTGCSHDGVLKPPLGVVWAGPPFVWDDTNQMALIVNGILVNPEGNALEGCDQYSGRRLWRIEAPGLGAGQGCIAASARHLFVRRDKVLTQHDLLTGTELAKYPTPFGPDHPWNWMAVDPDGKTVYGASDGGLFALETESGKGQVRWSLGGPQATEKFRASAMSEGRIYMLGPPANAPLRAEVTGELDTWLQTKGGDQREKFEKLGGHRDILELIAIDCATGKIVYRRGADITNCGGEVFAHNGVVVFGTSSGADKGWGAFYNKGFENRALTGYDGATGKLLWYRFANYRARPLIIDNTIHAEPWAYDLHTGERKTRQHPITGQQADWAWCRGDKQCGIFSASKHFLFGRSMGLGYQDLLTDQGLYTFWHSRGNCWMDCSSGGGLMVKPSQAFGCVCQWNMPFTIAMGQVSTQPTAAPVFAQPGPALPVKHLCLDFGATGDRRDEDGNLWIRSNLPKEHALLMSYPLTMELYEKNDVLQCSAVYTPIANTRAAFVFASTQIGLKRCVLPITAKDGQGKGKFQVRLGFVALPGEKPGQRVFDVKLNGRTVLENFDAAQEAGGPDRALWKEFNLDLDGDLVLELSAKSGADDVTRLPAISALEVMRKE